VIVHSYDLVSEILVHFMTFPDDVPDGVPMWVFLLGFPEFPDKWST